MLYERKRAEVCSTLLFGVLAEWQMKQKGEKQTGMEGWAQRGGHPPSAHSALQTQPPRYMLVACRNLRSCLNVTLFGVDFLASPSRNIFWILTFFPSAAQPAEPRCQRRLPQGLTGSCSTASARAPRCESLLWLRSFRSTLSFPFLWEHKRVSGGKFWKDVNTVGWSNQSKWQNFITTSSACLLFVSQFPKGSAALRNKYCLNPLHLQIGHKAKLLFKCPTWNHRII